MLFNVRTIVGDEVFSGSDKLKPQDKVLIEMSENIFVGEILSKTDKFIGEKPNLIIRKLEVEDNAKLNSLNSKAKMFLAEAIKVSEKHKLNLKITDGQISFNEDKFLILFVSDERVDFRNFVKELASNFHIRIELKQVSSREEVKSVGAMGICGRICCCKAGHKIPSVSIKMAKCQNLSLTPSKINGQCGKLLCCLAYENGIYEEAIRKMPAVGSEVRTPEGKGIVAYNNLLNYEVSVKFFDRETKVVTIKDFALDQIKV